MDLIFTILTSVAGGIASHAGRSVYDWLKLCINAALKDHGEAAIVQALDAVGNLSDSDIRKRVGDMKLSPPQAEELTVLLINLAHGARFHSTHGTPRSSFLRCERLLDQLLNRVLPKRRKGEVVATNAMPGWKLTRFLGMGSFGEVWEAQYPEAYPEPRAVKFFTSPDAARWIKDEQKTLFHVKKDLPKNHPNIISFVDVALDGQPFPYLLLEYADAGSLEEWILRDPKDRPALEKLTLIEGVVRGLSQAHENQIAHRDLKPANIMLAGGKNPLPKIGDFGLGRVDAHRNGESAQSSQGVVVGTQMYLPPEALQPYTQRSAEQDDVFAVGVIWYQLLVEKLERPPYDFADRLRDRLVDSQTIRVIERCLAQPQRRFKNAGELEDCMPPPIPIAPVTADCFDVQYLAREYLASKA